MQAAGHGIAAAAEFAARVQDGHDDLHGGLVLRRVHVDRDAAAVVDHLDPAVGLQNDFDVGQYPARASSTELSTTS